VANTTCIIRKAILEGLKEAIARKLPFLKHTYFFSAHTPQEDKNIISLEVIFEDGIYTHCAIGITSTDLILLTYEGSSVEQKDYKIPLGDPDCIEKAATIYCNQFKQ